MAALEILNTNDVPDDSRRFAVIGVKQWNELLAIEEFSSSDFVGSDTPFVSGFETKKWLGVNWILHNGLPLDGDVRNCFMYHSSAIGHACGQEVKSDVSWNGERAAHFICNSMSQGAVLIDETGIVTLPCLEA
jgi:hypothetical protein